MNVQSGRSSTQRNYTSNMRTTMTATFLRRKKIQGGDEVDVSLRAKVEDIELYLKENSEVHQSDRYEIATESLVLRRGKPFYIAIRLNRDFDPKNDKIRLISELGPSPNITKGTKNILSMDLKRTEVKSMPGKWDAVITEYEGDNLTLQIEAPSNCQVGVWKITIQTSHASDEKNYNEHKIEEDIYMLLNPWNKDDSVYMSNDGERSEYVMNDVGKLWMGSYRQPTGRRWIFGQFEDAVLPCAMYLLELSDLPHQDRGSPVLLSRAISAVINSADEGGLVIGRWDGEYSEGVSPHAWTGSVPIIEEFLRSGCAPVAYGQCWVFSGLVVTVCRALGLPCRSTTNYVSAHDTNSSLTVDKFFDVQGEEIVGGPDGKCHDSCWNFHVWNDVWMARPDLPSGYGGWQIIDATPQEMSGNMMRCGPASVEAVKSGQVGFVYDTPFVFSEVNADVCHFRADPKSSWGFSRTRMNQYHVGRKIVTKKVDVDDDSGDNDLWDVTNQYKSNEGTKDERMAVFNAVRGVDKAQLHYNFPQEAQKDVIFDLEEIDRMEFGKTINVVVKITNTSSEVRTIDIVLSASSVFYTGATVHRLKKANGQFKLHANMNEALKLRVSAAEYTDKLVDHSLIKIHVIANVLETRQTWSEEDDFPLIKPPLDIEIKGNLVVGEPCTATFTFINPLYKYLTNCTISVEGPGLQWPKIVKCPNVDARGKFLYTESFHPRKAGSKKIVGTVTASQMADITGSETVTVKNA